MSEDIWDKAAKLAQELTLVILKINQAKEKGEPVPHDLFLMRYQIVNELSAIAAATKPQQQKQ